MVPAHEPRHNNRQDSFHLTGETDARTLISAAPHPTSLDVKHLASTSLYQHEGNERSDEDVKIHGPEPASMPFRLSQVSTSYEGTSDSTMHFSLDITEDIKSHLEAVARLKQWSHFKEAKQYSAASLEHHLDFPLVLLEYCDLLVKQGCYNEFSSFVWSWRWDSDQKTKFLPMSDGKNGPDLYELHYDL